MSAAIERVGEADALVLGITVFKDRFGPGSGAHLAWGELTDQLLHPRSPKPNKDACKLVKLATFGTKLSAKGTNRFDENVISVAGVEGDYDATDYDTGKMSFEEALQRLKQHGIEAMVHTTASHTPAMPRWRVLAPLSRPHAPGDRRRLLGLLNTALGGVLAAESFTLSQAFYVGQVEGVEYLAKRVTGRPLDVALAGLEPTYPTGQRADAPPASNDDPLANISLPHGMSDDEIRECLSRLSADCGRKEWIRIGAAIHQERGDEGFAIFDEWSATSEEKYAGPEETRRQWDSFRDDKPVKTTAATLKYLANEARRTARPLTAEELIAAEPTGVAAASPEPAVPGSGTAAPAQPPDPYPWQLLSVAEMLARPRPRWTIKRLLPETGVGVVFGPTKSGKSFFLVDVGMAIARGVAWRGRKVKQGAVVYIAAEGASGIPDRMQAYAVYHGVDISNVPFITLPGAPDLRDKAQVKALAKRVRAVPGLRVLVLDTLAQVTPGADENSGADMSKVMAHVQAIAQATGALVLLVGHTGKDEAKGLRGWSGMGAAFDFALRLERDGDIREATIDKMKDGPGEGDVFPFHLATVHLGKDEDGDDVTSLVALEGTAGMPAARQPRRPKGKLQLACLSTLRDLLELAGSATEAEVVDAVMQGIRDNEKVEPRRDPVARALDTLAAQGHVRRDGQMLRLP